MSKLRLPMAESLAPVTVVYNPFSPTHTAHCAQCGESVTAHRYTWAATWAESHVCDAELVELLATLDKRAA